MQLPCFYRDLQLNGEQPTIASPIVNGGLFFSQKSNDLCSLNWHSYCSARGICCCLIHNISCLPFSVHHRDGVGTACKYEKGNQEDYSHITLLL